MSKHKKMKDSPSILQDKKVCYETHRTDNLHKHHIFEGDPNRKLSGKYGLWVYLTGEYHNQSNNGVHCGNHALDVKLKQDAQRAFEREHTRAEFMSIFGKSYL
jgi:hypothetical protein